MYERENEGKEEIRRIPILNIRMMSDEEWNRLAYKNYLENRGVYL